MNKKFSTVKKIDIGKSEYKRITSNTTKTFDKSKNPKFISKSKFKKSDFKDIVKIKVKQVIRKATVKNVTKAKNNIEDGLSEINSLESQTLKNNLKGYSMSKSAVENVKTGAVVTKKSYGIAKKIHLKRKEFTKYKHNIKHINATKNIKVLNQEKLVDSNLELKKVHLKRKEFSKRKHNIQHINTTKHIKVFNQGKLVDSTFENKSSVEVLRMKKKRKYAKYKTYEQAEKVSKDTVQKNTTNIKSTSLTTIINDKRGNEYKSNILNSVKNVDTQIQNSKIINADTRNKGKKRTSLKNSNKSKLTENKNKRNIVSQKYSKESVNSDISANSHKARALRKKKANEKKAKQGTKSLFKALAKTVEATKTAVVAVANSGYALIILAVIGVIILLLLVVSNLETEMTVAITVPLAEESDLQYLVYELSELDDSVMEYVQTPPGDYDEIEYVILSEKKFSHSNNVEFMTLLAVYTEQNITKESLDILKYIHEQSYTIETRIEEDTITEDVEYEVKNDDGTVKTETESETHTVKKMIVQLYYYNFEEIMNNLNFDDDQKEIANLMVQTDFNEFYTTIAWETFGTGGNYIYVDGTGQLCWPAPEYTRFSSDYGIRKNPVTGIVKQHTGIDLATPYGSPIVSAEDGIVVTSRFLNGYGNTVIIDHGNGLSTLYGHNSRLDVNVGDRVVRGQRIAGAGSTGNSTGNHLHFEVRVNGVHTDPKPYLGM